VPVIAAASFDTNYTVMGQLTGLAAQGKGKVAVILPDTTTSTRYVQFDAPDLAKAFTTAGLSASDFSIQNAQGSAQTQITDAQAAITNGASVIILDALDSGTGAQIIADAAAKGVKVIDYDRLITGVSGTRTDYYVSFDNVKVGTLIGQGMVSCASAWKVSKPNMIVMAGSPTDNNATLFSQGYNAVLAPHFASGWTKAASPAGTWDPPTALKNFTGAYTAHPGVNSVLVPNDENAAPIIQYLQSHGIKPDTFPITGQDATTIGIQNIISGYQCGTVYKPIQLEAQAAAAISLYLRAGATPPTALVNATTADTKGGSTVPSVYLTPTWVTANTVESTVVKDGAVPASAICTGSFNADCTKYGIS
jgi:D-xylose transport system substrate-binding protein